MSLSMSEKLFEANVKMEGLWPFPFGEAPQSLLEKFEGQEELPPELAVLTKSWSEVEIEDLFDGDSTTAEEAWSELAAAGHRAKLTGFIWMARWPRFAPHGEGSVVFSWARTRGCFGFGATVDEAISAACKRAEVEYEAAARQAPA
jgi:hypothetical protein